MREEQKLVPFSGGRRRPDPRRVKEFAAIGKKLQEERARSADVVSLLDSTPRGDWPSLTNHPTLQTAGALEQLAAEVEKRLDREPLEALAIADVAAVIAEALPQDGYPSVLLAQVRAHALKDRAQALSALARHEEALEVLDRADALLESFGTLGHDLAIIRYVRAATLQDVSRFDESLQMINECRTVFVAHGDTRRTLLCGISKGVLLQRMKRFRDARETYIALLDVAQELNSTLSIAGIHNNVGHVCTELGEFDVAERHLSRAVELYSELKLPVRVAGAELARGRMLVRRGDIVAGIAHLHRVRTDLGMRGVVEESGICGLEIVEALLIADRPAEAESLAREVVFEFTAARLNTRAITAVGFLQEAIAARKASVETVDRVRQYILSLRRHPKREFLAAAG